MTSVHTEKHVNELIIVSKGDLRDSGPRCRLKRVTTKGSWNMSRYDCHPYFYK